MTLHLLDTDAIIDLLYNIPATVTLARELSSCGEILCVCDIVVGEVCTGLHPHERSRADALLSGMRFLVTSLAAARQAGEWRYAYARRGQPLAITDCIIAGTAVAHGATLVTGNVKISRCPS
jgi:tRNA(fMet)-specific endonuclease VapC